MDIPITNLIPLISALLGAIVGGLIGFFSAGYADIRRRNYELKKEAYYAFLKLDRAQIPLAPSQWKQEYFFAKNGIDLWGSQKVKRIVEDIMNSENWSNAGYFSKRIKEDFLPAIKEDLSKPWWKLW
jgi:hypothetical protein